MNHEFVFMRYEIKMYEVNIAQVYLCYEKDVVATAVYLHYITQ